MGISKAQLVDLREGVVATGSLCQVAEVRFGVSAATAVRWASLTRKRGAVAPGPLGGDRRSAQIEAHAAAIWRLIGQKSDMTLDEIGAESAKASVSAGFATVWRRFDRCRMA